MFRCTQTVIATSGGGSRNPVTGGVEFNFMRLYSTLVDLRDIRPYSFPGAYVHIGSSNTMHNIGRLFSNVYTARGMERR